MRRVPRWLRFAAAGVAALVLVALLVVYGLSERVLRRAYPAPTAPAFAATLPADAASLAEGRRLAVTRGCYDGCHGAGLAGRVFMDKPGVARIVAPNLTAAVRRYSDAELERIIRHGVRPDGRSVFVMPSEMFRGLSDADLARLLAFMRSQPSLPDTLGPSVQVGPLGRLALARGVVEPTAVFVRRDSAAVTVAERPVDADALGLGRYVARTSCTECHGPDLRGGDGPPSLAIATAYAPAEFRHFLRTGEAKGGRELRLMSDMARNRFSQFTDAEIGALHAYLRTLAAQSTPAESPEAGPR